MPLSNTTTSVLLCALTDPSDSRSWQEFDARYRPLLIAFARRLGLDEDEALDAAQETLTRFLTAFREGKFDREKGRLQSWINGIARNCVREMRDRRERRREHRGLSALADWPDDQRLTHIWDEECQRTLLRRALNELRDGCGMEERTIRTFELLALEEKSPADIAKMLGITRNEVYIAKHRCLSRLRDILDALRQAYEFS